MGISSRDAFLRALCNYDEFSTITMPQIRHRNYKALMAAGVIYGLRTYLHRDPPPYYVEKLSLLWLFGFFVSVKKNESAKLPLIPGLLRCFYPKFPLVCPLLRSCVAVWCVASWFYVQMLLGLRGSTIYYLGCY